jgi:hypothetical protein
MEAAHKGAPALIAHSEGARLNIALMVVLISTVHHY